MARFNTTGIHSGGLPAKIAGIVFWGMVMVGLLIALLMLHGRDRERMQQNAANARLVGRELEVLMAQHPQAPLQSERESLLKVVESLRGDLAFEAVELAGTQGALLLGEKKPGQESVVLTLHGVSQPGAAEPVPIRMTVFFPDRNRVETEQRKRILLSIGLMMMAFGLILQQILQRLLSRPFFAMVDAANRFADGDTTSRFDERRSDEFGFLAKFINRALDSIVQQQKELRAALARATQSEAALSGEKERAEVTLQAITDAVITTNAAGEVQYLNPVAERMTGWTHAEAHGLPVEDVVRLVDGDGGPGCDLVRGCLGSNSVETLAEHSALLRRDGERLAIEASAAPMRNDSGEVIGAVMVCQDVSQARKLAHQLSYQASHDALTGLVNRHEFDRRLGELLGSAKAENKWHVLLYLDLDQFKVVNDTCGHIAGDQLLSQLAVLLDRKVRRSDTLARLGGDEFGVLLEGCDIGYGEKIAETLRQEIADFRFVWEDKLFQVGVSIGLVPVTAESEDTAKLLSAADAACYMAKDEGRNQVHVFYGHENSGKKFGEMQWIARIHKAIEENRLRLYRQNIAAVSSSGSADYAEILLRMDGDNNTVVPPMAFIPAAERYN
ncbi:MAG: diguanylate cyclase, partial [Sulfuricellaceae bacterium]|nr:diguanylate cyclase [Sulfuricellaceae bacterium]